MKKSKLLALAMAGVICMSSSTAMAQSYNESPETQLGYLVTIQGSIDSLYAFHASTRWALPNGEVTMYAAVYTRDLENGEIVLGKYGYSGIEEEYVSMDQNDEPFASGMPSIVKMDFRHTLLYPYSSVEVDYTKTISY